MGRPLIMITNDDGYQSPGLAHLVKLMKPLGDVVVVAPESPQSGQGHAITLSTPLRVRTIVQEEGYAAYVCNGTPVDCVKLGQKVVLKKNPDLLVSGINHGSNSSVNVIYSGTMAAVIESCLDGIPSIGFSLTDYAEEADFSHTDSLVNRVASMVLQDGLPNGICLNVNIPKINGAPVNGLKVCRQAKAFWDEKYETRIDPRKQSYYWLTGVFKNIDDGQDTDEWALAHNYASVVPIQVDFTAHHLIDTLKTMEI